MTDIDDLDLTPQQRNALQRADKNPEHVTEKDIKALGTIVVNREQANRVEVARIVAEGSKTDSGAPDSFVGLVPSLITALNDEEASVRRYSATALGEIGRENPEEIEEAIGPLITVLDDESWLVRKRAAAALGEIGGKAPAKVEEATGPLIAALDGEKKLVRKRAAAALGEIGSEAPAQVEEATGPLIAALDDKEASVRAHAARALERIGREAPAQVEEATGPLIAALDDKEASVRRYAARALGEIGLENPEEIEEAIGPLITATGDESWLIRKRVSVTLQEIVREAQAQSERFTDPLIAALDHGELSVRANAALVLGLIGREAPAQAEDAIEPLIAALDDEEPSVRGNSAKALGRIGREAPAQVEDAIEPLIAALDDEEPSVRRETTTALGRIDEDRSLPDTVDDKLQERLQDNETEVKIAAGFTRIKVAAEDWAMRDKALETLRNGLTDAENVWYTADKVAELAAYDREILTELESALEDGLNHSESRVRMSVAQLLGEVGLDRLRRGEAVGQAALADRADLYANALEYARGESLRECQRWATEMQKFVRNNPVDDAAYETVEERVASFVENWFAGRESIYGDDHEIIVGGDIDLQAEEPKLYHDIADIAEEVRRLYMRSS